MFLFNTVSCAALLLMVTIPFSNGFGFPANSKAAAERLLDWLHDPKAATTTTVSDEPQQVRGMTIDIRDFRYEQCGTANSAVRITKLDVGSAFTLPGTLPVNLAFTIGRNLSSPIRTSLQLYKKEIVWIKLPCQIGPKNICTYEDICQLLPPPPCPSLLTQNHIPCECPAAAGSFEVKDFNAVITNVGIKAPSWLVDGNYKIEVSLHDSSNSELGCLRLYMHISRR